MATLTTTPTYPPPKRAVDVTFTAGGAGNFVRVFCTAAPPGSDLDAKIQAGPDNRVQVYEGGISEHWHFTPDVGGVFVFSVVEITRGATTHGGSYARSPDGDPSETIVNTNSRSVYIGERLTWTVGFPPDRATLVVWVWNATIRATTMAIHGEVTPAVVKPQGQIATTAARDASLLAQVAALVDVAASTALGSSATVLANLRTKFAAHMASGTYHATGDTDNAPADKYATASVNPTGRREALSYLAKSLFTHSRNDSGTGIGTRHYHAVAATDSIDWGRMLPSQSSGIASQDVTLVAALWRAYEAHRADATLHGTADSTNTLTALPSLFQIHKLWLDVTDSLAPTAPAVDNAAAITLVHGAGFVREPL